MGWDWLVCLLALLKQHPEIALSIACFFYFHHKNRSGRVLVNWPILGMLPSLVTHFGHVHDFATDALKEAGCTLMFKGPWFLGMNFVLTCDPANANHIFNINHSNYGKGDDFLEIFEVLGDGIFRSDAESWRIQRKKAHAFFGNQRFRSLVASCSREKVERGLIPLLNQITQLDMVVDLECVFRRFTFDSTCISILGIDPCSLDISFPPVPFEKALDVVEEVILYRHTVPRIWWKLLRWLRMGEEKKMVMAEEVIDHFLIQVISKRREEMKKVLSLEEASAAGDMLTSYIEEGEDSIEFNKFLRDTTLNFMSAGTDTVGSALSWFFWLISTNPCVETKILEELRELSRRNYKEPHLNDLTLFNADEIQDLIYLHAALCECLRLFPPVPFQHKGAFQAETLPSGHKVRPGTTILFSIFSMGRMEGIWGKDCLEFKPERWISEQGKLRHEPSYKFLTFNSGPRTCLGKDMTFTQMKVVVAAMIYNFQVEVLQDQVVEPKFSAVLHMKNGMMVRVRKREAFLC